MRKFIILLSLLALLTITTHAQNLSSEIVGVRDGALIRVNIEDNSETILNEAEDGIEFYPLDSNSNRDILVLAHRRYSDGEIRLYDGDTNEMRVLTDNLMAECPPHFVRDTQVAYVSAESIDTYETETNAGTINPIVLHDIETNNITHIQDMRLPIGGGGGGGSSYAMAMVVDMDYYNVDTFIGDPRFFRVLDDNTVLAGEFRCLGNIQHIDDDTISQPLTNTSRVSQSPDATHLVSLNRFDSPPSITFVDVNTSNGTGYGLDTTAQQDRFFAVHWAQNDMAYFTSWQRTTPTYTLTEDEQNTLFANEFTSWDWTVSWDVTLHTIQPDNGTINPVTTFGNTFQITNIHSDASNLYVSVVPDGTPVIEAFRAGELVANSNEDIYSYLYPDIYRIPFDSNQPERIYSRLQRFMVIE